MKANELREKSDEELNQLILDFKDDLMHFRLQMATGVVDNVKRTRGTRRDIARVETILNERRRGAQASAAGDNG